MMAEQSRTRSSPANGGYNGSVRDARGHAVAHGHHDASMSQQQYSKAFAESGHVAASCNSGDEVPRNVDQNRDVPLILVPEEDYESMYVHPFLEMYFDEHDPNRYASYTSDAVRIISITDETGRTKRYNYVGINKIQQSFQDSELQYIPQNYTHSVHLTKVNFVLNVRGKCVLKNEEYEFKTMMISHRYIDDAQLIDVEYLELFPALPASSSQATMNRSVSLYRNTQHGLQYGAKTKVYEHASVVSRQVTAPVDDVSPTITLGIGNIGSSSLSKPLENVTSNKMPNNAKESDNEIKNVLINSDELAVINEPSRAHSSSESYSVNNYEQCSAPVRELQSNPVRAAGSYSAALVGNAKTNQLRTSSTSIGQSDYSKSHQMATHSDKIGRTNLQGQASKSMNTNQVDNRRGGKPYEGNIDGIRSHGVQPKNIGYERSHGQNEAKKTSGDVSAQSSAFSSGNAKMSSTVQRKRMKPSRPIFQFDNKAVYIKRIPKDVTEKDLSDCFEGLSISKIAFNSGASNATIFFADEETQQKALNCNATINDVKLIIDKKRRSNYNRNQFGGNFKNSHSNQNGSNYPSGESHINFRAAKSQTESPQDV